MKVIMIIIPKHLVTNSLLFLFCPLLETKGNQILSKLVVWLQVGGLVTRNILVILITASSVLLQRHTEFNRLL